MDLDVEGIIRCIRQGDESGVQTQLQEFNKEYAQCFFFDAQERDQRKFRRNKVRDYVESDSDCDEYCPQDHDVFLRQTLTSVLVRLIRTGAKPRLLRVCLRTLRILSRDKKVLVPLVTDCALLTLAKLAGLTTVDTTEEANDLDSEPYDDIILTLTKTRHCGKDKGDINADVQDEGCCANDTDAESDLSNANSGNPDSASETHSGNPDGARETHSGNPDSACETQSGNPDGASETHSGGSYHRMLARGRKDRRESQKDGEEEDEEEGEEAQRKEAMKVLCNVVYNSTWAQERFSDLRLLCGLTERLANSTPSSGQFYELRLMFLMTALQPELRVQLQQEGGVSILTAILEQCLEVQWKDQYEVVVNPAVPPISLEASQRTVEILKVLFNITHSTHRQEPDEEDAALYRHLVAVLHLCLMRPCELTDDTDELQGHTVNLLSALPLRCLDVLLSMCPVSDSPQSLGVNMDCVHTLLLFMERRLEAGDKVKEKLTPVLNLLTESCRAHRETRRYIREYILPPLRDVSLRPEEGSSVKSRLIRLMTHLDTDLKHCAADLIFVLCKENVSRFVKYTGYGNAAGLLATRGLLGGQGSSRGSSSGTQYSSDSGDSDTEEYRQVKGRVNPVTGRVEAEQPDPMAGMTEEEKEEEAQRLVMLFSKLSRDNIIQPMGVNAEGKLVPVTGLRDSSLAEEEESGSESDAEPDELE